MKLRKLKKVIDACVDNAGDCDPDIEIWVGDDMGYRINNIGQFSMIPDVAISIEKIDENKGGLSE